MEKQLLDKNGIDTIVARISDEILEKNLDPSSLFIVGIKKRGDILANRIAERIESANGTKIQTEAIDITFYRDDIKLKAYKYVVMDEIQFDVTEKNVILVDDVIYTGRSIRAAIDVLIDTGRPKSLQLAVLVDRGGRELPIQPDYCGEKAEVSADGEVNVSFNELDGDDKVLIS